jgi:hypothetical protein
MSQQVDANLVELARKWLDKMLPYRRIDASLSSVSQCFTDLTFFRFLLSYGCYGGEVIGVNKDGEYVYLRCGIKLARLNISYIRHYCYEQFRNVVGEVPTLSEGEEYELVDKKPYGGMDFSGSGIHINIFGGEPVYLGALKDVPLYLEGVEVASAYLGTPPQYRVVIRVGTDLEQGGLQRIAEVRYGEVYYIPEKVEMVRETSLWGIEYSGIGEELELKGKLLAMLNKKYPIMDKLLGEVAGIFVEGFRAIIVAMLY